MPRRSWCKKGRSLYAYYGPCILANRVGVGRSRPRLPFFSLDSTLSSAGRLSPCFDSIRHSHVSSTLNKSYAAAVDYKAVHKQKAIVSPLLTKYQQSSEKRPSRPERSLLGWGFGNGEENEALFTLESLKRFYILQLSKIRSTAGDSPKRLLRCRVQLLMRDSSLAWLRICLTTTFL
jgi:hypothetical protein